MNEQASGCPFKNAKDIDFMSPEVQENWFEAYDILRAEEPVYYMPELGMYVLTRYEDIAQVVRQPDKFTTGPDIQGDEPLIKFPEAQKLYDEKGWPHLKPLNENLPQHRSYRRLVDPYLTLAQVRNREPFIRSTINELIDGWIDKGEIEFMKEFAEPLPMIVIAKLLGFPRMDLPQLKEWSYAFVLPFSRGLSEEDEIWAVEKHIELQNYIFETAQDKRRKPGDDIITRLTQAEFEDPVTGGKRPLTDAEIIGMTDNLLIGGNETTTFSLSSGLWLLYRFPEVYEELEKDHSKIKGFVEEVLRMESPTQGMYRYSTEDSEIGGVKIPRGSLLSIRFGAGNRDPEKFPEPGKLDVDRKNANRHMAFSLGEHHCPGAALSRLEQQCAWDILLTRLDDIRPVKGKDDFSHVHGIWLRALKQIHMKFDKAF